MPFASVIELADLDGSNGFQLSGVAAGDNSGFSVSSAGDVNGDGIDDLIIGAGRADPNGTSSGASYVVFGGEAAFAATLDLSTLNGSNGFRISGGMYDRAGFSVASAGDVNGDGIGDLIIGAPYDNAPGFYTGAAYVVFGKDTADDGAFAANVNLFALDPASGFQISGAASVDQSGWSVDGAGDINGDGFDDVIIGAWLASPNGTQSGASYVVFGSDAGFGSGINLASLDGNNGFQIRGAAAGDRSGDSVSSAGDVNGDGFDDLIVGAWRADADYYNSGASYVVFGDASFGAAIELSALDGSNGFRIGGARPGDFSGCSVASAGDVNGDGVDDLIIGAYGATRSGGSFAGASFVVFGSDEGFDDKLDLATLNGANGFRINGPAAYEFTGFSVAGAGDINGDGLADLIIGAPYANGEAGATYVVFGSGVAFAATIELSALNGTNGFKIAGESGGDRSGWSVSAAGDVNGDGIDDLLVGAPQASPNGSFSGASYIIFGQVEPVIETGTAGNDSYVGDAGQDVLSGAGGNDVLSGLNGNDVLDGGDLSDILYGGGGADDLVGGGGGDVMYGDAGDDQIFGGEGGDKLFGGLGADLLVGELGNDRFDGGDGIDSLNGGQGNDYLDGGAGADVMSGGTENDIYLVDDLGDQTIEALDEGYDIVRTELDGWVLAGNVEGLQLEGAGDIDGTGNGLANNMQGSSGANTIYGLAGNDTINGADGNDIIVGGLGGDQLRGGAGADSFVIGQESTVARTELDQIHDFSITDMDIIDLSGIDAIAGGTDDAFSLVGAFGKHAGEMTLTFAAGITTLKLDINGDAKADYTLKINGDVTGDSGRWML